MSNRLPVARRTEPVTGNPYYVYVPSYYTDQQNWALVISCHGTPFWDIAKRQAEEWSATAEEMGFIVAAPELTGTRGDIWLPVDKQIRRQEKDERRILALIKALKSAYQIAEDQVFLTGWSAGNYAVLHTGLRHPEVFRALAIRQGNFDPRFIAPLEPTMDRHQPILVSWGNVDLLKSQSRACYDWLRERGMAVEMREISGGHRRHPDIPFTFFLRCLKEKPWLLLRVDAVPDNPMAIRTRVTASPPAQRYAWDFGDGGSSAEPRPEHVYAEPGEYTVTVRVRDSRGHLSERSRRVIVPWGRVGPAG